MKFPKGEGAFKFKEFFDLKLRVVFSIQKQLYCLLFQFLDHSGNQKKSIFSKETGNFLKFSAVISTFTRFGFSTSNFQLSASFAWCLKLNQAQPRLMDTNFGWVIAWMNNWQFQWLFRFPPSFSIIGGGGGGDFIESKIVGRNESSTSSFLLTEQFNLANYVPLQKKKKETKKKFLWISVFSNVQGTVSTISLFTVLQPFAKWVIPRITVTAFTPPTVSAVKKKKRKPFQKPTFEDSEERFRIGIAARRWNINFGNNFQSLKCY